MPIELDPVEYFFQELENVPLWEMDLEQRIIYSSWALKRPFTWEELQSLVGVECGFGEIYQAVLTANETLKPFNHAILQQDDKLELYILPEEPPVILSEPNVLQEGDRIVKIGTSQKGKYLGPSDQEGMARVVFGKPNSGTFYEGLVPFALLQDSGVFQVVTKSIKT